MINRSFKICNNWNSFRNDIENIKSNHAYPPFLIDKVIKEHFGPKFSSNKNQSKDTSDVYYFRVQYIGNLPHHIKNKLSKLCKHICKEKFNINIIFHIKIQFLMIWNLSLYINLLVLAVVLVILAKLVVILKLGLRNISSRITSLLFLNIYTPPEHALTHVIPLPLK